MEKLQSHIAMGVGIRSGMWRIAGWILCRVDSDAEISMRQVIEGVLLGSTAVEEKRRNRREP